jgi:hypothetical protein
MEDLSEESETDLEVLDEEEELDLATLEEESETAPVVKLVNIFLTDAIMRGASDIHIEPPPDRPRGDRRPARSRRGREHVLLPQDRRRDPGAAVLHVGRPELVENRRERPSR